jgi:hypothetical protein
MAEQYIDQWHLWSLWTKSWHENVLVISGLLQCSSACCEISVGCF